MSVWPAVKAGFGHRFAAGVALVAGGALFALALASWSPDDPVPLLSAGDPVTSNLLGPTGALVAEIAFQLVGAVAVVVPILMLLGGIRRLRPTGEAEPPAAGVRALLVASLVVSVAGLLGLAQARFGSVATAQIPWGGYLGALLQRGLASAMGEVGTGVTLTAFAVIAAGAFRGFGRAATEAPETFRFRPVAWTRRWIGAMRRRREREETARRFVARIQRRRKPPRAPAVAAPAAAPKRSRKRTRPRTLPLGNPKPDEAGSGDWKLPSIRIFTRRAHQPGPSRKLLAARRMALEEACEQHRVRGEVVQIQPGPVVTTFEYRLGEGQALKRLQGLREEICMALRAPSIRVERVRGRDVVGVEVPNEDPAMVGLRELLEDPAFAEESGELPIAVGRLVDGRPLVRDLVEMPHLLVAGATGAGKSVLLNALLCSLLYRRTPDELRLILVDMKRMELQPYESIPHLLTPLIKDPEKAKIVLLRACREMDRRMRLLEEARVRNITGYNQYVRSLGEAQAHKRGADEELPEPLSRLVVVIDELQDLFAHARAEVTPAIQRLLALGRAEGIHLVLATQRPSTDVISGTLKANLPSRIAFRVATQVDSKVILDRSGAEHLIGKGDMLMMRGGAEMPRAQGAFVTEKEVKQLTRFWAKAGEPAFDDGMLESLDGPEAAGTNGAAAPAVGGDRKEDEMLPAARDIFVRERKASTSMLQTELGLGYQRSRRIVAALERQGVVGPQRGAQAREVLVQP